MNKLIKIAPIIVILAAAGSLFFGFKLDQMKKSHLAKIASLNDSLNSTTRQVAQDRGQIEATPKYVASTQADLATANTNLQNTTAALAQKTQEAEGLKTQVAERDQQLEETKTDLASAKEKCLKRFGSRSRRSGLKMFRTSSRSASESVSLGEEKQGAERSAQAKCAMRTSN